MKSPLCLSHLSYENMISSFIKLFSLSKKKREKTTNKTMMKIFILTTKYKRE